MFTFTVTDNSPDSPHPPKIVNVLDLNDAAEAVDALRMNLLFEYEDLGGAQMNRYAEIAFLKALTLLEQAKYELKIGWMEQLSNR